MRGSNPENDRSRGGGFRGRDYQDPAREREQWRDERGFEGDWNQYRSDRNYNQDYDEYEDRGRQRSQGRGSQYRDQDLGPGRRGSRAWDEGQRDVGRYPRQFTGRDTEDFDAFEDQDRGYYGSPQRAFRGEGYGGFGSARGRYQGRQTGRSEHEGRGSGYGSSLEGFGQYQRGSQWDQPESESRYGRYGQQGGYGGQWREQRRRQSPKGYTRSDDRIREDVCEQLAECQFDISNVSVDVKQGKVTLEGSVSERRMKHQIEDIADNCMGVKDVDNKLRVQREGESSGLGESQGRAARREH